MVDQVRLPLLMSFESIGEHICRVTTILCIYAWMCAVPKDKAKRNSFVISAVLKLMIRLRQWSEYFFPFCFHFLLEHEVTLKRFSSYVAHTLKTQTYVTKRKAS